MTNIVNISKIKSLHCIQNMLKNKQDQISGKFVYQVESNDIFN